MKNNSIYVLALAGVVGFALTGAPYSYAWESSNTGNEMHDSGASSSSALHETGQAVKHAYRATKNELSDATLTTKVKSALLADSATRKSTIHVSSDRGVVTLSGDVDSPAAAARARDVVASVKGVESVNNNLTWHTSAR